MRQLQIFTMVALAIGLGLASLRPSFAQEAEAEAVAEAVAQTVAEATPSESPKIRPLTVSAGLIGDVVITGTLLDSTAIAIKTAFGEASIPLSEVAGIRFPASEDTSTTVMMLNGDSITGATDLKFATVETSWGSAKINGQNIATMLFVPGLTWQPIDGLSGKRWTLVESSSVRNTAPQVQPGNVQPAGGMRPQNGAIQNPGQPQVIFGR